METTPHHCHHRCESQTVLFHSCNPLRVVIPRVFASKRRGICSRCNGQKAMPREYRFFVYIMASKSRRLYTDVTNNIERRVAQHKAGEIKGFTQQYNINRLVYFEVYQYVGNAIRREKAIKHWVRAQRVALIERDNPTWDDLSEDWGKPIQPLKPIVAPAKADPPRQGREG